MTQRGTPGEVLRGVVEATNERGIKLGGRWLNYSQFRQVPRAETGQEVEVEVERDRFINALTVVGGSSGGDMTLDLDDGPPFGAEAFEGLDMGPSGGAPGPGAGAGRAPRPAPPRALGTGLGLGAGASSWAAPRPVDRNTEIRRLALIKAAADYAAAREPMTADDVLAVARRWEAWIIEREPPPAGERSAAGAERGAGGERGENEGGENEGGENEGGENEGGENEGGKSEASGAGSADDQA